MKTRVGVDRAPTTMSTYVYTRRTLAEFIKTEFKVSDLAFGQLNEQFIRDYQDFCLEKKRLACGHRNNGHDDGERRSLLGHDAQRLQQASRQTE